MPRGVHTLQQPARAVLAPARRLAPPFRMLNPVEWFLLYRLLERRCAL